MVSPRREQYSHLLDEMVGCGDMVMLDPLSEETLMENLRKRYKGGHIYVSERGEGKAGSCLGLRADSCVAF